MPKTLACSACSLLVFKRAQLVLAPGMHLHPCATALPNPAAHLSLPHQVVVITLPVLGQAAAMWTQRTVGTLLGGLLACGLLAACRSPAYLSVMAPLLAGAGHCWGEHSSFSYA